MRKLAISFFIILLGISLFAQSEALGTLSFNPDYDSKAFALRFADEETSKKLWEKEIFGSDDEIQIKDNYSVVEISDILLPVVCSNENIYNGEIINSIFIFNSFIIIGLKAEFMEEIEKFIDENNDKTFVITVYDKSSKIFHLKDSYESGRFFIGMDGTNENFSTLKNACYMLWDFRKIMNSFYELKMGNSMQEVENNLDKMNLKYKIDNINSIEVCSGEVIDGKIIDEMTLLFYRDMLYDISVKFQDNNDEIVQELKNKYIDDYELKKDRFGFFYVSPCSSVKLLAESSFSTSETFGLFDNDIYNLIKEDEIKFEDYEEWSFSRIRMLGTRYIEKKIFTTRTCVLSVDSSGEFIYLRDTNDDVIKATFDLTDERMIERVLYLKDCFDRRTYNRYGDFYGYLIRDTNSNSCVFYITDIL